MVQVVPWLVEREYQQHKNLNYEVLPETFAAWREMADTRANRLAHANSERVVKVVIHPRELEDWAHQMGRVVDDRARSMFATILWQAEAARWSQTERRHRLMISQGSRRQFWTKDHCSS